VNQHLVEICQRLHAKNLLASADGNVSFRVSDDEILITPAGVNKARLKPEHVAVITLDNRIVSGNPSSERLMHLEVYRNCPKAKAIVHAHPPTAIAFTVARPAEKELPSEGLSELILAMGRVPVAPYARPGTLDMGTVLQPFLPECRVILLARHGAISWGEDLEEAYNGMERLEHVAGILKSAVQFGGLTSLPEEEVAALRALRAKLGDRTL
jgi:L-fuculose-phosphate aldolase